MASPRSRRLSVILVGALLLAGLEVFMVLQALNARRVGQDRVLARTREEFLVLQPELERALLPGGQAALQAAARLAFAASAAREIEYFEPDGRLVYAHPKPSPVEHWPAPALLSSLRPGRTHLVFGPFLHPNPRILTYAQMPWGDGVVVVRLSASAAGFAQEMGSAGPLLAAHLLALSLCAILIAAAFKPVGDATATGAPALLVYEQAMERLRDQGEIRDREHAKERGRLEELLRDRQAMVRAGELTAGIVHEVRNGLGTVTGHARLAGRDAGPAAAESLDAILGECATLEGVIRRFTEFIRDERLSLAPLDLRPLLARVSAREARARPEVRLQTGPYPDPFEVIGDEALLERAFENLVRNALEAAGPGGEVAVGGVLQAGAARVFVSDDGPGFPAGRGAEPKVFFTTKPKGLGLGLPTALKVIQLHQGRLDIVSRHPRGVSVSVVLPCSGPEERYGS